MIAGAATGQQCRSLSSARLREASAIGLQLPQPPRCIRRKEGLPSAGEQRLRRFQAVFAAPVVHPLEWQFPEHASDSPPTPMLGATPWIQA